MPNYSFKDYFGNQINVGDYAAGANRSGRFAVGRVEKLHKETGRLTIRTATATALVIINSRNCAIITTNNIPPEAYLRMQ